MSRKLFLDFETKDPYINEGLGSGWPFYKEGRLKILCFGYAQDSEPVRASDNLEELRAVVQECDTIICHNTNYDVGILKALNIDYSDKTIVDTIILAKLYNNELFSYSLDDLARKYLGKRKFKNILGERAEQLGLVTSKRQNPDTVAINNLDILYKECPETVLSYVKQDVEVMRDLYKYLMNTYISAYDLHFYSDLIKATIEARSKGVRIDKERAREVAEYLVPLIEEAKQAINNIAGDININSPKQLREFFISEGVDVPTPAGKENPSVGKEFLQGCDHPLAKPILEYRKLFKVYNDFVLPILESPRDRVYPELTIFGGKATGRASCSDPNLQNIPSRDKVLGPLVRSMYLPEEGEQWASLDYSSQESRILIHLSYLMNDTTINDIVETFNENPCTDLHRLTAALIHQIPQEEVSDEQRTDAKAINLGISYGMGRNKLARQLGKDPKEAEKLLKMYHQTLPYIQRISDQCMRLFSVRGYIKTISGRRLIKEGAPVYKALNKAVQGSAADQTNAALVEMYRQGIPFILPIHDSIEVSVKDIETVKKIKHIMENATQLCVPSVVDIKIGSSWGTLEKCSLS